MCTCSDPIFCANDITKNWHCLLDRLEDHFMIVHLTIFDRLEVATNTRNALALYVSLITSSLPQGRGAYGDPSHVLLYWTFIFYTQTSTKNALPSE